MVKYTTEYHLSEHLEATYIQGSKGPLFCLRAEGVPVGQHIGGRKPGAKNSNSGLSWPLSEIEDVGRHYVLFVPPFGEEINLCRRFYSLVRAQLTKVGVISLLPDVYGTGDSGGLLEEADWAIWRDDLVRVVRHFYLDDKDECGENHVLSIIAMRAGCLFAANMLDSLYQQFERVRLENIVFVEPEINGKDVINRLFRARVMAQRLAGNRSETTQNLWTLVEKGECVHAGGLTLSSTLCHSMRDLILDDNLLVSMGNKRTWFNLQRASTDSAGNTNPRFEKKLPLGWNVQEHPSPPFWQAYEIEPEKVLVEAVARAAAQLQ